MRSIWRVAVSFGLVSIAVKLYSATEDKDIRFHQVHATDGGRVKYKRVCSIDGEEVEYSDIAKGYELPDGDVVILTDEDFEDLPLSTRREIEVLQFVDQDEIDPIMFEKTYYLEPDGPAARPYVLLRDALENAGQVAITKIAIRQRESLAASRGAPSSGDDQRWQWRARAALSRPSMMGRRTESTSGVAASHSSSRAMNGSSASGTGNR